MIPIDVATTIKQGTRTVPELIDQVIEFYRTKGKYNLKNKAKSFCTKLEAAGVTLDIAKEAFTIYQKRVSEKEKSKETIPHLNYFIAICIRLQEQANNQKPKQELSASVILGKMV